MAPDAPRANSRENQKEEAEDLVPQRMDRLYSRGHYGSQEKTRLARELALLFGGWHPAARQTPRYAAQLLRVRHAPMLSNRRDVPAGASFQYCSKGFCSVQSRGLKVSADQATDGPEFASL
jgi:hypothetical protein